MRTVKSTGSSIAGNVVTTISAGEGEFRSVLYGQVILTTDATVANRRVVFRIVDEGDNDLFDSHSGAVVAASASNQHHEFMQGIFRETSFVGGALQVPIPINCVIPPGYGVQLEVENGVAGDSYDYTLLAETTPVAKGSVVID
jgi:hypothetical protein